MKMGKIEAVRSDIFGTNIFDAKFQYSSQPYYKGILHTF